MRHNLREARRRGAGARVVAVVKANGYGHGAARLLPALAEADMLGVACIEEALVLREAGAAQPILLMEGVFEADELPLCARLGFRDRRPRARPARDARGRHALARPLSAWLKLDTGMNRLGFRPAEALAAYDRLRDCAAVADPLRLMTHFASADAPADPATRAQLGALRRGRGRPRARALVLQLGRRARLARGPCRVGPARRHALRRLAAGRPHRRRRGPAPGR